MDSVLSCHHVNKEETWVMLTVIDDVSRVSITTRALPGEIDLEVLRLSQQFNG